MKEIDNVVIMPLEYGMHGVSVLNHDGSITVILNSRDSHERQIKAYQHELKHIEKRDFEKHDVQEIENQAHEEGRMDKK